LLEEDGPWGDTFSGLQLVRSISSQSALDFDFRQALRSGGELRHDGVNGQAVPHGRNCAG
jgi:hypothetical protein